MSEGVVNVGIVGMGIGRANGGGFHRNPRCRVAALCDLDEPKMAEYAATFAEAPPCYTDYREMCASREIDAVFVGTPNQWHVPVALEAVRRGKHVLVTKPLADSLSAAEMLVAAAESAGVVNMMSLVARYRPAVAYLKERIAMGEFGEVYYGRARSVRRAGIPTWSLGFIQEGGGAFRDMGVHVLDASWWLMGRPQPVSVSGVAGARFGPRGLGYNKFAEVESAYASQFAADDYAGGFVRFADGVGLQVESFWASHQPNELTIELLGTEAGARTSPFAVYRTKDGQAEDLTPELPEADPWADMAGDFAACILDGAPCEAPLRDGLVVQGIMEGLLASAETGREVRLDG